MSGMASVRVEPLDLSPSRPSALTSVQRPLNVPEMSDGNGAGKDARVHDADASTSSTSETSGNGWRSRGHLPHPVCAFVPADAPAGSSKSSGSPNSTTRVNSFRLDMSAAPASACTPRTLPRAPPPASPRIRTRPLAFPEDPAAVRARRGLVRGLREERTAAPPPRTAGTGRPGAAPAARPSPPPWLDRAPPAK